MKKINPFKSSILDKRWRRNLCSILKRKLKHSSLEKSEVKEKIHNKLRLMKYPNHYITRPRNYHPNKRILIMAPKHIDYYHRNNFDSTNKFINDIQDCLKNKKRKIFINFSDTETITAAAMLSLLAEVDVLTKKSHHGRTSISFNHPKKEKLESVLKQIGFYDLLEKEKRKSADFEDVTFWNYCSANCSEPMIAKPMLEEIAKELQGTQSKKLYRGFIEAMSNSVEHAYLDDDEHCEEDNTAKWWAFAGIKERELTVVLCDKGVGIPKTLPKTQGVSKINDILTTLGYEHFNITDSKYIKAATNLSKTRTGQKHRGKGLTDIKAVIDSIGKGSLLIYSNKGEFRYKAQKVVDGVIIEHKTSVSGTIIEWMIPLD